MANAGEIDMHENRMVGNEARPLQSNLVEGDRVIVCMRGRGMVTCRQPSSLLHLLVFLLMILCVHVSGLTYHVEHVGPTNCNTERPLAVLCCVQDVLFYL